MQAAEGQRAIDAAMSIASTLELAVDDVIVLQDANRLVLRLMPCDVVARIAPMEFLASAELEVELAQRLAEIGSPIVPLAPQVPPRVYARDGFVINMWTYCETVSPEEVAPADYAHVLELLHAGMRHIEVTTPHFTDRVAEAQRLVESSDHTPALTDADRELLTNTLRGLRQAISAWGAAEQLLHGEPHPGNLLGTKNALLFADLETCCRGPVEFDVAHVPQAVSQYYPGADQELVAKCRALMLAMIAAWRWRRNDQHPNGRQHAAAFLSALREGPPWPTLDVMAHRVGAP